MEAAKQSEHDKWEQQENKQIALLAAKIEEVADISNEISLTELKAIVDDLIVGQAEAAPLQPQHGFALDDEGAPTLAPVTQPRKLKHVLFGEKKSNPNLEHPALAEATPAPTASEMPLTPVFEQRMSRKAWASESRLHGFLEEDFLEADCEDEFQPDDWSDDEEELLLDGPEGYGEALEAVLEEVVEEENPLIPVGILKPSVAAAGLPDLGEVLGEVGGQGELTMEDAEEEESEWEEVTSSEEEKPDPVEVQIRKTYKAQRHWDWLATHFRRIIIYRMLLCVPHAEERDARDLWRLQRVDTTRSA